MSHAPARRAGTPACRRNGNAYRDRAKPANEESFGFRVGMANEKKSESREQAKPANEESFGFRVGMANNRRRSRNEKSSFKIERRSSGR